MVGVVLGDRADRLALPAALGLLGRGQRGIADQGVGEMLEVPRLQRRVALVHLVHVVLGEQRAEVVVLRLLALLIAARTDLHQHRVVELADRVGVRMGRQRLLDLDNVLEPVAERHPIAKREPELLEHLGAGKPPARIKRLVPDRLVARLVEPRQGAPARQRRSRRPIAALPIVLERRNRSVLGWVRAGPGPSRRARVEMS